MRSPRYVFVVSLFLTLLAGLGVAGATTHDKASPSAGSARPASSAIIPGPLSSFLRMAAVSQKVTPEQVLPLVARNAYVLGWERESSPTEYLLLVRRYVHQARELVALAGKNNVIEVTNCDDAKPLLAVLGYRLREGCGKDTSLETAAADRAFVTLDSGFPLAALEDALRTGKPFSYPYASTQVPAVFSANDWAALDKPGRQREAGEELDDLLENRAVPRLYWAMSRMDSDTRDLLRRLPGVQKLLPVGGVLDFFGSYISVRSGKVLVPGGAQAEPAWKDLVGAGPEQPEQFIVRLLARDKGWLAAYFDALSRIDERQQSYFVERTRLRRFYEALRSKDIADGPAKPVFRPDGGLLLLVSRLQFGADGQPRIPGNLDVWKQIFRHGTGFSIPKEWASRAGSWQDAEQLIEGLFGVSRVETEDAVLRAYLAINEVDRGRSPEQRLTPQMVRQLADRFPSLGDQYPLFAEFHDLNNASIAKFLGVADKVDRIRDVMLRGNALGIVQAEVGLWQILARQGQIPPERLNASWQEILTPFSSVRSPVELYDASRVSFANLERAATGKAGHSQDDIIALLAAPAQETAEGQQVQQELARRMRAVLQDQRLVSLDTLFGLGDGLTQLAQGQTVSENLLPLAQELREFEFPRPLFTSGERVEYVPGLVENTHTGLQTRIDLTKTIKNPGSRKELIEARGVLAALVRDTLVGLNYAYYEPPAAQMLHHNPLFVRSHDFSGVTWNSPVEAWKTSHLFGSGISAARGAHLVGSLANLPSVLARVEQDFMVPETVQALIWDEVVPSLITSAVLPRWWGVSRNELHAVALYQHAGEELLSAAAKDEEVRHKVLAILADRMPPQRCAQIEQLLTAAPQDAVPQLLPAEAFYLAGEFRRRFPDQTNSWGAAGTELAELSRAHPDEVNWQRLSDDFGVPHPALEQTYAREVLNIKPFPAVSGYGCLLVAESWDSSNLYWGRLADELGYPPVMLNRLAPELMRRMVEKISATDLEDYAALMRAMQETGEEFRSSKGEAVAAAIAARP